MRLTIRHAVLLACVAVPAASASAQSAVDPVGEALAALPTLCRALNDGLLMRANISPGPYFARTTSTTL